MPINFILFALFISVFPHLSFASSGVLTASSIDRNGNWIRIHNPKIMMIDGSEYSLQAQGTQWPVDPKTAFKSAFLCSEFLGRPESDFVGIAEYVSNQTSTVHIESQADLLSPTVTWANSMHSLDCELQVGLEVSTAYQGMYDLGDGSFQFDLPMFLEQGVPIPIFAGGFEDAVGLCRFFGFLSSDGYSVRRCSNGMDTIHHRDLFNTVNGLKQYYSDYAHFAHYSAYEEDFYIHSIICR